MLVLLFSMLAFGADTHRTSAGDVVIVQPDSDEKAAILNEDGEEIAIPFEATKFWLVNPDSMRAANALSIEYRACDETRTIQKRELVILQDKRDDLAGWNSQLESEVAGLRAARQRMARQRWNFAAAGVGVGAVGVVVTALVVAR